MITFTVIGRPQQRGSKRATMIPKRGGGFIERNGRPLIVARDMNEKSNDWMSQVRNAGHAAWDGDLIREPVKLNIVFYFKRPKSHYRTGKRSNELRDDAPLYHAQMPDLSKLVRCLEDALTGIVWVDDKQVACYGDMRKLWTTEAERAEVGVEVLAEQVRGEAIGTEIVLEDLP